MTEAAALQQKTTRSAEEAREVNGLEGSFEFCDSLEQADPRLVNMTDDEMKDMLGDRDL